MQLVVPRAVKAAVRMLTMTCRMVFQVSFFMVSIGLRVNTCVYNPSLREGRGGSLRFHWS